MHSPEEAHHELALGATTGIDRLVIFGGGLPIQRDGQLIGAVVSGGHYSEDMDVAQAGLDGARRLVR